MSNSSKKLTQQEIDNIFLLACSDNDLDAVKNLYNNYPPIKNKTIKSVYSSFLKIFKLDVPALNIHTRSGMGLKSICEKGSIDILKYLISLPEFTEQSKINDSGYDAELNNIFSEGLFNSLSNKHFEIADLIVPFIKNQYERSFILNAHLRFLDLCLDGNLDGIKFLINNEHLDLPYDDWIDGKLNSYRAYSEGFIEACREGHIDIVQYFTSSHELSTHVNLKKIDESFEIKNIEIIRYFIFDLNINKNHPIFNKIIYPKEEIDKLLEKRELFNKLSNNIPEQDSTSRKRPKI
jgi:hypothetical protein